jgi:hypothetical protein
VVLMIINLYSSSNLTLTETCQVSVGKQFFCHPQG